MLGIEHPSPMALFDSAERDQIDTDPVVQAVIAGLQLFAHVMVVLGSTTMKASVAVRPVRGFPSNAA